MKARFATPDDVLGVLADLRRESREEMLATRFGDDPRALAAEIAALEPYAIAHLALTNAAGRPFALAGAWMIAPGVASVQVVSTPQWFTYRRAAYRWLRKVFWPCVLAPNVRRAETRMIDRGETTRRFIAGLGATIEGRAVALGRNGEDFLHVAWINPAPTTERSDV